MIYTEDRGRRTDYSDILIIKEFLLNNFNFKIIK